MWNPLSWVMEVAALMAIALAYSQVRQSHSLLPFLESLLTRFSSLLYKIYICILKLIGGNGITEAGS